MNRNKKQLTTLHIFSLVAKSLRRFFNPPCHGWGRLPSPDFRAFTSGHAASGDPAPVQCFSVDNRSCPCAPRCRLKTSPTHETSSDTELMAQVHQILDKVGSVRWLEWSQKALQPPCACWEDHDFFSWKDDAFRQKPHWVDDKKANKVRTPTISFILIGTHTWCVTSTKSAFAYAWLKVSDLTYTPCVYVTFS